MARKKTVKTETTEELSALQADVQELDASGEEDQEESQDIQNQYKMFSNMSLDEIQEFLNTVSQKLTTDDLVFVDLADAQTVSTPIVQAIISLNRFAGHTNKKIKWQNPSNGFSEAFNNLGFYSEMMRLEFA